MRPFKVGDKLIDEKGERVEVEQLAPYGSESLIQCKVINFAGTWTRFNRTVIGLKYDLEFYREERLKELGI